MIPFFTLKALNVSININIIYIVILSCFIYISASFVPIPGASVGTEYSFINYMQLLVCETVVIPSLLLFRFISYYIPCIVGGILFNYRDGIRD